MPRDSATEGVPRTVLGGVGRFAPGIPELVRYRLADVPHDLVAGLSVAAIGTVPAVPLDLLEHLIAAAAGIALVSFSSAMLTARSFAEKNRYDIDVDREFAALGAANIASAVS